MAFAVYSLPNYEGDKLDLVALDPTRVDAGSPGERDLKVGPVRMSVF